MKKTMKFKRYDEGGEVAAKEAGLKASKDEDVGFLKRLRMGNIDDPSSDAYKRFGAGRGLASAATTTESKPQIVARIPPKPRELTPNEESGKLQNLISSGSDIVGRPQNEGYRPNEGTAMERATKSGAEDSGKIIENTGPRTKPSKPAMVTKDQMTKEGFDNLRDYLNFKQGLKRRKEKDPTPKLIDPSNIRSDRQEFEESLIAPKLIDPSNIRSGPQPEEALLKKRVKGMKSGGSVSSASNRADGCATKGKTKGTMITMKNGGKC